MADEKFEPKIVAFTCNWCSYAGADLAGTSRIQYAPNMRIIRVMCSGRVEPNFILEAFQQGADGVCVLGCHFGDCHYISGNYEANRRMELLTKLFKHMGLDEGRIMIEWVSASEGERFSQVVNKFTEQVRELGPLPEGYADKIALLRGAIEGERLRIVLGSTKRAFDSGGVEEEKYNNALFDIARDEIDRVKMFKALDKADAPLTVPQFSEMTGIPKMTIWRHVLSMTRKNILEAVGEEHHYMLYQRRAV
ncbi:MAG: hydrogenase iron-sulfur subunit [Candidatus Methanofastidiosa archaeon]|nr:hydrogenase iron-sulfur subunit [Candidatus Methanofastidiosa archaeon]